MNTASLYAKSRIRGRSKTGATLFAALRTAAADRWFESKPLASSGSSEGVTGITHIFSPKKEKATQTYIYVSDVLDNEVFEFDYPNYDWIGTINTASYPLGECTRNGKGTFWVTASGSDEIEEFNVGGTTPVKTLSESAGKPASCAIDPATGDLAATIASNGDVILYKNASGSGTVMTTPLSEASFDGYDNSGNLFVDGFNSSAAFELVELPKGSSTFQTITTSNTVEWAAGVQWDGKYVTVNDLNAYAIYRYTVSGTRATLEDTVHLRRRLREEPKGLRASDCTQDAITTHFVYCPDPGMMEALVYKYPAGGRPIAYLRRSFDSPEGAVILVK